MPSSLVQRWAQYLGRPKPQLFVFRDLPGHMVDEKLDPRTGQHFIGMSAHLFHDVRNEVFCRSGYDRLREDLVVTDAHGREVVVVLQDLSPAQATAQSDAIPDSVPRLPRIVLRPHTVEEL